MSTETAEAPDLTPAALEEVRAGLDQIRTEVNKILVGQQSLMDLLLVSLLTEGHSLLVGVPGLAKTRSVRALADALHLSFSRIQFTPDLLPSDITGTEILEGDVGGGRRAFRFEQGPVFANLVLADEINRTPPRTQAALLESMQERGVTVGNQTHPLPSPFLVLATQNPIEQEGTFPLPEAQLDRFFFSIHLEYPEAADEVEIVRRTTVGHEPELKPVSGPDEVARMQRLVPKVHAPDQVVDLAVKLIRATRPGPGAPEAVRDYVAWGAGPRGSQVLIMGAKARALMAGRDAVGVEDLVALMESVLRHRLVLNFAAERDRVQVEDVIAAVREAVVVQV